MPTPTSSRRFLRLLHTVARCALAVAFLAAGLVKLGDPTVFAVTVDAFGLLPDPLVMPLAVVLPVIEIAAALGLLWNTPWSLPAVSVLLGVFILVLVWALRMGLDIDCGCYGPSDPEAKAFGSIWTSLYRDLGLSAGVLLVMCCRRALGIVPRWPWQSPVHPPGNPPRGPEEEMS